MIRRVLERLVSDWALPKAGMHRWGATTTPLQCTVDWATTSLQESQRLPHGLGEFWAVASGARLFIDVDHGQWGLELLSPAEAEIRTQQFREQREQDLAPGDLVVGRFVGDLDLLMIRCDASATDYGHVLVALPMDPRRDWYCVADSLEDFLVEYEKADGEKYWEVYRGKGNA